MSGWLIIVLLIALILAGMPIGFALMTAAAVAMVVAGIDLIFVPVQLFSGVNSVVLLAVPLYILMGELMSASSISDRLVTLAQALVGWMRGGLAHANVVSSMFMAEMSGSAVADAAMMGKIFIPSMAARGYPKGFSAAVTATSATLGIIIPPSIPMVLYGVTANVSIRELFIAGIVPGLLLGGAFMLTNHVFAKRNKYPADAKFESVKLKSAFRRALVPLLIPVFVVGGLIAGLVTPTEAAALGVFIALIFGLFMQRDIGSYRLKELLISTVRQTSVVMMIVAGSAVFGQFLANEQLPQQTATAIGEITDNFVFRMLLLNLFLLAVGMVLHASAAIIIIVPILLPLAVEMGVDPIHFGVIVCLNLGIGQQTPPVASVLLTVCSVSNMRIEQVMPYAKWFILAMFVVLMIVSFIPATALWFR